jgi:hypothetical protein
MPRSRRSTASDTCSAMERETGIEPASSAWKAEVLPLNYSRPARKSCLARRFRVACCWWREVDSNHRRRKPADLQSAPVGRLGIPPTKNAYCVDRAGNCQHLMARISHVGAPSGRARQVLARSCGSTNCSIPRDNSSSCRALACRRRSASLRGSQHGTGVGLPSAPSSATNTITQLVARR